MSIDTDERPKIDVPPILPAPPAAPRRTLREMIEEHNPVPAVWRPAAAALGLWTTAFALDDTHPVVVPLAVLTGMAGALGVDALRHPGAPITERLRRLRRALLISGTYGGWLAGAAFVNWQQAGADTAGLTLALAGGAAARYIALHGWPARRPVPAPEPLAIEPARTATEQFVHETRETWQAMVDGHRSRLQGTRLGRDVAPVRIGGELAGWRATVHLGDEANPDVITDGIALVARAYRAGIANVSLTLDPFDASRAYVVVLKVNTLYGAIEWDGQGIRPDGTATVGRHMAGADEIYRFWDSGGTWHSLIAGATRSGKSELVGLLMTMEMRYPRAPDGRPLILSYLIDPQHGQSYGELIDGCAGVAFTLDDARTLIAQIEAEMLWRNMILAKQTWTDERGNRRRGVKVWKPTPEMPLICITVDEAHSLLMDQAFRDAIARIGAMAAKCGILLRLITQVPLLSSLGGKMEIRDAVASGNVFVFRTANQLSGQVAANGTLPGKPHLLPRVWHDGTTAAGLNYSAGPAAVPELARTIYVGDTFYWLHHRDGTPMFDKPTYPLPEPHVPEVVTAEQLADQQDERGMTARQAIAAYMAGRPGEQVATGDIMQAMRPRSSRGVSLALRELLTPQHGCVLIQPGHGLYQLNEAREVANGL